jgi:MoaA/NifB/PqqE/SkfB family radical SAM enzyme
MQTVGSWKRAWNFVRRVKAYGNCVHVHSVVTKLNYTAICELARSLEDEGVPVLRLLRLVPQGRARNRYQQLALTPQDWKIVQQQLHEIDSAPRLSLKVRLGGHISAATQSPGYECSLDSPKLVIEPDGTVAVCPALKGLSGVLGSPSMPDSSLINIMRGSWRQDVAELKAPPGSDCPAQRLYAEVAYNAKHAETVHAQQSPDADG